MGFGIIFANNCKLGIYIYFERPIFEKYQNIDCLILISIWNTLRVFLLFLQYMIEIYTIVYQGGVFQSLK